MTVASAPDATPAFRHEALLYDSTEQFFDAVVPFVEEGVQAGEPVLVILEPTKAERLRSRLRDPSGVEFADMSVLGANPARILPHLHDFVDRHGGGSAPGRGVGEPIGPARSGDVLTECQIHETLINVALSHAGPWQVLCPYDSTTLRDDVLVEARRSHPYVRSGASDPEPSAAYVDADHADRVLTGALAPIPPEARDLAFTTESLPAVRGVVHAEAVRAGLHGTRAADFELAVGEAAANALLHGGDAGRLRLWDDGTALLADVADAGRFSDLLAGRVRPTVEQIGGRGLWIAQQVCDLVQVRSAAGGTSVRLHMRH